MKLFKRVLLGIGIITALIFLGCFGLQSFGKKIYDSRSCDFGNIDNIELHTRTDIPDIKESDCMYDEKTNTKKVVFTLHNLTVKIPDYIKRQKFIKAENQASLAIAHFKGFAKDSTAFATIENLYYKKASNYDMILNSESKKLWVYLKYKD